MDYKGLYLSLERVEGKKIFSTLGAPVGWNKLQKGLGPGTDIIKAEDKRGIKSGNYFRTFDILHKQRYILGKTQCSYTIVIMAVYWFS